MRPELDEVADTPLRARRVHALPIVLGVVLLGILPGAGYLHWRAPEVRAQIAERMESAPRDPMGRLDLWLTTGEPNIQSRLSQLKLSARHPWLVTHSVQTSDLPEIWGLDLTSARPARFEREGLRVELHFPRPALLGHGHPSGDNAARVPSYASRELVPDPSRRAQELLEWFLGGIPEALAEDIPGAELVVVIDESPPAVPSGAAAAPPPQSPPPKSAE